MAMALRASRIGVGAKWGKCVGQVIAGECWKYGCGPSEVAVSPALGLPGQISNDIGGRAEADAVRSIA